jgi:hypothetical protein
MPQRALAAFRAISRRSAAVSALALAGPPFLPPSFPRATAAGFFLAVAALATRLDLGGSWPVAIAHDAGGVHVIVTRSFP